MSELVEDKTKVIKANAALEGLVKEFNIRPAGTGTPFWTTLMKRKQEAVAVIHVSQRTGAVFFRAPIGDKEINLNLGLNYDAIQSMVDYEGQKIKVVVAPRIPNADLTEAEIEAVENNPLRGKSATANIRAARAAKKQTGELILISYTEPED